MSESELMIKIYGLTVCVSSTSKRLVNRLKKDFHAFLYNESLITNSFLTIECNLREIPKEIIPKVTPTFKRKYVTTYDIQDERINDYNGRLLSIINFSKEQAVLFSPEIDMLHEITYLLILSRTAKTMDQQGLHKIHGLGFNYKKFSTIIMMRSGGGKSTLLSGLLENEFVKVLSDDTPLINESGDILGFPLRIGMKSKDPVLDSLIGDEMYILNRQKYGLKYLYPLLGKRLRPEFKAREKQILIAGLRDNFEKPSLCKITKSKMLYHLFVHQIIGMGLPIIFEYFWEKGITDFFIKASIFLKRLRAAIAAIYKSELYEFKLSNNPEENSQFLLNYLDNR